ncbi:MAG TPA: S9 family peptidase [Candidatus Deferrimicrobiaceae bacterium]
MHNPFRSSLFASLALVAIPFVAPAAAGPPPLVPLEDFFRNPEKTAFSISPDGRHLAWLAPWKSRLNVWVRPVDGGTPRRLTSVRDRDIARFRWAGNRTILFSRDSGGDENFHLYRIGLDGGEATDLTPYPGVQAEIDDPLEEGAGKVPVTMNRRDPKVFDRFRLDVRRGTLEAVEENPGHVVQWIADHRGRVRAAMALEGTDTVFLYRDREGEPFRKVFTVDFRSYFEPVAFTFDDRRILALSGRGRDMRAAVEIDPSTGEELKVLYGNPEVDTAGILLSRGRKRVEGFSYATDRVRYRFIDRRRARLQEKLEARFPGMQVSIGGRSRDERRILFTTSSDRTPGAWHLYDSGTGRTVKVADIAPWIDPANMAAMKPVSFTSRDGVKIHGYLTLPAGLPPKDLPAILLPHGGPESRDIWGYSPTVQFLANRGYAVLQVNFRGSTLYGRKFREAGFRQRGIGVMQNDKSDGVLWLVREGIADPKRIAIFGGSYGGYAALAGLAFTPELYAAGVSYVGISSIFTFLESIPPYWEPARKEIYEKWGDPVKDRELLLAASPLYHVDRIRAPLFIAQGAKDPRVKKSESDQMVRALRGRGIPVPYMVRDDEGHGFRNEENRRDFYRALEAFFSKYLGGRTTTDPSLLGPLEKTPA